MISQEAKTTVFICVLLVWVSVTWGQTKIIKCPNGEIVTIQKRPEKFYKDYVKKTDLSLKGTISVLDKVKLADLEAGTKGQVTELREKLDQYSSRYQDLIKGALFAYNASPCDTTVRKRYFDLLESLNKENTAIEKLRVDLSKLTSSGHIGGIDDATVKKIVNTYQDESSKALFK